MPEINARPWFALGFAHLGAAALLGLVAAAPSTLFPESAHVLVALAGLHLLAGGLAHGFLPPFLKREPRTALLAHASLALVLLADAALLVAGLLQGIAPARLPLVLYGAGFALLPAHVALAALWGIPWRGGIALFAKDQPFRRGDVLAGVSFLVGLGGLLAGGLLLAFPPRGLPSAALAALLLAFAPPFFGGYLLFILPRNAKTPLPGLTLHGAALALLALGALGLVLAFAFPVGATFRHPAAVVALAHALALTATLRLDLASRSGPQLDRARPFLRGAFVLGVLAPLVLVLATVADVPQLDLLRLALYLYLALAATTAVAATLFGAPILLNAVPRDGRWGQWAAALAIAGLFLLAPTFQHPRAAFPGALVLALAAALVLWGVWPMRHPRRACD